MPSTTTYATACHVSHLRPMTGSGYLVRPRPDDDLVNLHGSDWTAMLRHLRTEGWAPTEGDEADGTCHEGYTADGRQVIGLCGHDPIVSRPTVGELAEDFAALREVVGPLRP